jgi:hypothetical protein
MKKILFILIAIAAILLLSGCTDQKTKPAAVGQSLSLNVATAQLNTPQEMFLHNASDLGIYQSTSYSTGQEYMSGCIPFSKLPVVIESNMTKPGSGEIEIVLHQVNGSMISGSTMDIDEKKVEDLQLWMGLVDEKGVGHMSGPLNLTRDGHRAFELDNGVLRDDIHYDRISIRATWRTLA